MTIERNKAEQIRPDFVIRTILELAACLAALADKEKM